MLAIKQSLLLILILTSSISEAQNGRLIFYTKPNKGIVKIDTFLLNQEGKTYNVDTGKYIIQVWAPTSKLITDTILIKPN